MALGSLICGLSKHVPDEFMVISFRLKSHLLQHNVPFWITVPIRVKKDDKDAVCFTAGPTLWFTSATTLESEPLGFSVKSTHLFYTVYALNTSINISLRQL